MAYRKLIGNHDETWYRYCSKAILPFLCCMTLILFAISLGIFTHYEGSSVFFLFIGIFYWSFHGHAYFHPAMAVFLGLWVDLLIGQMIGIYSFAFIVCYIICHVIRDKFWQHSIILSLLVFIAMLFIPLFAHLMVTLIQGYHANIGQLMLSMLIAILCYIPLYGIFTFLRRKLW